MDFNRHKGMEVFDIVNTSKVKELRDLNVLLGKYVPYRRIYEDLELSNWLEPAKIDHINIRELGKKYYGNELLNVWYHLSETRYSLRHKAYRNKYAMPKGTCRDNKRSYNTRSGGDNNSIRYPSLKRSKTTWRRFYTLFPYAERRKEV